MRVTRNISSRPSVIHLKSGCDFDRVLYEHANAENHKPKRAKSITILSVEVSSARTARGDEFVKVTYEYYDKVNEGTRKL